MSLCVLPVLSSAALDRLTPKAHAVVITGASFLAHASILQEEAPIQSYTSGQPSPSDSLPGVPPAPLTGVAHPSRKPLAS